MIPHRVHIAAAAFLGAAFLQSTVLAQKPITTGAPTGVPGATTGTTTRNPFPTNNPSSNTNSTSPFPNTIQRPIFLSGKVVIQGGLPLPTGVSIVRVCGTSTRTVAYTDSKGRFQFEWGRPQGILPDASDTGSIRGIGSGGPMDDVPGFPSSGRNQTANMGQSAETEMLGCELRAAAPGYQSDSVNLSGRRSMDNPDVGVIVLHRMGNVEGTSISATSFNAPKDAKKAFDKGIEQMHKGKSEDATRNFEKAVEAYPKYADAWYQLGRIRSASEDQELAKDAYVKALDADSKLVGPSVELGLMSVRNKNWTEAVQYLDRAVRLDPIDFPQAWFANAIAHFNLKSYDAAEKSVREAIKLDPKAQNPRARYLLGLILAEKQDYAGASKQLKEFLRASPDAKDAETVRKQLGQLEKLASAKPEGPGQAEP